MPRYKVKAVKYMYAYGETSVDADSPEEAVRTVDRKIGSGELQTTSVDWGDPVYEDFSFSATGDVEEENDDDNNEDDRGR